MPSNITSAGTKAPSRQDVPTPRDLLDAIEKRFGVIGWDLAATRENAVCTDYFGPDNRFPNYRDSLNPDLPWDFLCHGRKFLNPPFATIRPWVDKASQTVIVSKPCGPLVLLPAAVCTDWFNTYVRNFAKVYELFPRPFKEIRDCILADYADKPGRELWVWK